MITYQANYEPVNKPYICKVFTASNGEEMHTALNFSNEAEKEEMSVELIYEHLSNVIKYIQDRSETLTVIGYEENINEEPWAIKGWKDLEWANNEAWLWWNYIYFKDRPMSEFTPAVDETPHTHDGTEDHTHDPETGEEIPNA